MRRKVVVAAAAPSAPNASKIETIVIDDPRDRRREYCPLHGWVGLATFELDRHDLCDPPVEEVVVQTFEEPIDDRPRGSPRARGLPRKRTVAVKRITQQDLQDAEVELEEMGAETEYPRPTVRSECQKCPVCQLVRDGKSDGRDAEAVKLAGRVARGARLACGHTREEVVYRSRPCVMVGCKYALYLDVVQRTGSITFNFPHLTPDEMDADRSCALDLAERGGMTLDDAGSALSITRERLRQLEVRGLVKLLPVVRSLGVEISDLVGRHVTSPGSELQEEGVDGAVPSDVASLLDP